MLNNTTITINPITLQDCLVNNNRYANVKINSDQLGDENFKAWKKLVEKLHVASYGVYALCENSGLTVESATVDKTMVYSALREILAVIGDVNGHKIYANEELATLVIGYSGKRGNSDSPELQLCLSKIKNRKFELEKYEKINGVKPETIQALKDELKELEEQKEELLDSPDNRIKAPTRSTANGFRLEVEHRLARVITDQKAESWEALEAKEQARKAARKNKNKARKNAKKAQAKINEEALAVTL